MLWLLVTSVIFLIWVMLYNKNKKLIFSLPYLLIFYIAPWYKLFDVLFFVKVFGCGCVPIAQTNMFNIPFNANDLRLVVYSILIIVCTIMGCVLSKRIHNKILKIIYVLLIIIVNILFSMFINYISSWA